MTESATQDLRIIGIGSSAGGLEAIKQLVNTLPVDLPVTYIVVQHMSPHHKSLMTSLVARDTQLQVRDVVDGTVPQKNVVYITPPRTDVIFVDGALKLVDPNPAAGSPKPSVDRFLTSLALDVGERSMGIILSGTGSDGSYGIQAIREAGGITIAQDVDSAKYDGMPQAAVRTGCIDLVLSPFEIGEHLTKILSKPRGSEDFFSNLSDKGPHADLLQILLARTQVDFRDYKQTTIGRRVERRMVALNITSEIEYTDFCRRNPSAVDALFKDLLISVTRFFRDREVFKKLEAILPRMIEQAPGDQVRVWIAGCATGEEAYSIAMLICDALEISPVELESKVQIFATDIDKDALAVARKGRYRLSALSDIPPALAEKYAIRENDSIRMVDGLRNAILFSDHNVCQAPPFQRIDLLCCRNLLIYFSATLQHKVMGRFHYSLSPKGLMFLGAAESVAGSDELFVEDQDAAHVFRKRAMRRNIGQMYSMPDLSVTPKIPTELEKNRLSTDKLLLQALVQSLGENSVLVTEGYFIAEVFGDISPYISLGKNTNLRMHIDLLRSPLREEARSLITVALKSGQQRSGVRHLLAESDTDKIRLDVFPIIAKEIGERGALIVFTPLERSEESSSLSLSSSKEVNEKDRIQILEQEVLTTREALEQTLEELETSSEELQSLNEELQSTNEELQATNEELETSNEELQSTNEELITVNEELQVTASELTGRTGELSSVLQTAPLVILVADPALQVTQATTLASELFKLQVPLSEPHISQCVLPDGYPSLAELCSESLKLGTVVTKEFNSKGNRVVLTSSPSFSVHGQISGVVVFAAEFSGLVSEMETIFASDEIYIMQRNLDGIILRISSACKALLDPTPQDIIGQNISAFKGPEYARDLAKADLEFINSSADVQTSLRSEVSATTGEEVWLNTSLIRYFDSSQMRDTIYSISSNVTGAVREKLKSDELASVMRQAQENARIGNWTMDISNNTLEWSPEVHRIHGTDPEKFVPSLESGLLFYHPDDRVEVDQMVRCAINEGKEFRFIRRLLLEDSSVVTVFALGMPILNSEGETSKVVGVFRQLDES